MNFLVLGCKSSYPGMKLPTGVSQFIPSWVWNFLLGHYISYLSLTLPSAGALHFTPKIETSDPWKNIFLPGLESSDLGKELSTRVCQRETTPHPCGAPLQSEGWKGLDLALANEAVKRLSKCLAFVWRMSFVSTKPPRRRDETNRNRGSIVFYGDQRYRSPVVFFYRQAESGISHRYHHLPALAPEHLYLSPNLKPYYLPTYTPYTKKIALTDKICA
jgi:hypothetical protein